MNRFAMAFALAVALGLSSAAVAEEVGLREATGWKATVALHEKMQAAAAVPAALRAELKQDFDELESALAALEKRIADRGPREAELAKDAEALEQEQTRKDEEGKRFDAAKAAHHCSGDKACAECARLVTWAGRCNAQKAEFEEHKRKYDVAAKAFDVAGDELEADISDWNDDHAVLEEELGRAERMVGDLRRRRERVRSDIEKTREQIAATQEALRRLDRSAETSKEQIEEWTRASEKTLGDSERRLGLEVAGHLLDWLETAKKARLDTLDRKIARARKGIKRKKPTAEQRALLERLRGERGGVESDQRVVERIKGEKLSLELALGAANDDASKREKILKTIYSLGKEALADPGIQQALKIGGGYAVLAGELESYVESGYEITVQVQSYLAIARENRAAEDRLKAIRALSEHMKKLVERLNSLKQQLAD